MMAKWVLRLLQVRERTTAGKELKARQWLCAGLRLGCLTWATATYPGNILDLVRAPQTGPEPAVLRELLDLSGMEELETRLAEDESCGLRRQWRYGHACLGHLTDRAGCHACDLMQHAWVVVSLDSTACRLFVVTRLSNVASSLLREQGPRRDALEGLLKMVSEALPASSILPHLEEVLKRRQEVEGAPSCSRAKRGGTLLSGPDPKRARCNG